MEIIKLKKIILDKLWGNEEWLISAHENGMSYIDGGKYDGISLKEFYKNNKALFGIENEEFPLLVKIINAKEDLSIQVHPNNKYAKKNENSLGKSECWYILNAAENSDIVIGQNAKNKEELNDAINQGKIMEKLNVIDVKKGDFFDIPPGCVHAIRKDTKIYEVQQSSDITYRLFDYNRKDNKGNLRELHINKSLDVIDYNYENKNNIINIANDEMFEQKQLLENEYFKVDLLNVKIEYIKKNISKYIMGTVINGKLNINGEVFKEEESFIILKDGNIKIKGEGSIIISTSK